MYVVGKNESGELGVSDKKAVTKLTQCNIDRVYIKSIQHINCGCSYTIITDSNNYPHCTGYYLYGSLGFIAIGAHGRFLPNLYFPSNNITLQRIFTSPYSYSTFWLSTNNILYASGYNVHNNLGIPDLPHVKIPTPIPGIKNVKSIGCGLAHTIILTQNQNITSINDIISNWTRICLKSVPNEIILIIYAYYYSTKVYATKIRDAAYYGRGQNGCGDNNDHFEDTDFTPFTLIPFFIHKKISQISVGFWHSLFLEENGIIWSCGGNEYGQLGLGHCTTDKTALPQKITYFKDNEIKIQQIESGAYHNLILDMDGKVYKFGDNGAQQKQGWHVGDEDMILTPKLVPIMATKFVFIVEIKCGDGHSYLRSKGGGHYLFGNNMYNQCTLRKSKNDFINTPLGISKKVAKMCNGAKIKSVYLGASNTIIIVQNQ